MDLATSTQKFEQSTRVDIVRTFLVEIGRVPLLTGEQEINLSKQVQQMMLLLQIKKTLIDELSHEPTLNEWAERAQVSEANLNEVLRIGQRSKRHMIEANLRLVVTIAKKYQNRGLEFLDLIQEGTIGLERGVEKFDPMRGYKFSTYAYHWIRQAITRAIATQARAVRLPVHIIERINKIKRAQRQLSQKLGRNPKVSEIATELGFTLKQVRECMEWGRMPVSLNSHVRGDRETELVELLEDPGVTPEEYVMKPSQIIDLERLMADLTDQQREVLALRYGLLDGQELTLAKTGDQLNISRERVRQIEQQALKQLHNYTKECTRNQLSKI